MKPSGWGGTVLVKTGGDKLLLVILDGLGDQAQRALGGKTPLQVARTSQLDHLALLGGGGSYHPGKVGMAYFSDLTFFMALGYAFEEFPGRGVLGCYASQIPSLDGVYLWASLASVEETPSGLVLVERGKEISLREWMEVTEVLSSPWRGNRVEVSFHPVEKGVGVLQVIGDVAPFVTDSDPSHRGGPVCSIAPRPGGGDLSSLLAAELNLYLKVVTSDLSLASFNKLRVQDGKNPMNALLLQGAGQDRRLPDLEERWGITGLVVASDPLVLGVGRKLAMDVVAVEEEHPRDELLAKFKDVPEFLETYDLVVIHTRAPKLASHRHDPWEKVRVIEEVDSALYYLLEKLVPREDILLTVWGGASTSTDGPYLYSGEPSPLIMLGSRVRRGPSLRFDESSLAYGSLGLLRGDEMMFSLLSYTGRAPLEGRYNSSPR